MVPLTVPSLGVTSTARRRPGRRCRRPTGRACRPARSGCVNVRTVVPLTFQTKVRPTGSPSASVLVAVAVSGGGRAGLAGLSATVAAGAVLATVTGLEVTGRARGRAVVDRDPDPDEVAPVAVAGGGEVERGARGAADVGPVAGPLVGGRERLAVGVVAGHGGGQGLAGGRVGRADRGRVDDRRGVGRGRGHGDRGVDRGAVDGAVVGRDLDPHDVARVAVAGDRQVERVDQRARALNVRTVVPLTFQTKVRLTGSPSASLLVAVAVTVAAVLGLAGLSADRGGRGRVGHGHRARGQGRARGRAVVDRDPDPDEVAPVAVAGGGQVERGARGAADVGPVAGPLVGGRERLAVGVVAGHGGGQGLAGGRVGRADRGRVDDRRGVGRAWSPIEVTRKSSKVTRTGALVVADER